MGKVTGDKVDAWWYSPKDGHTNYIGSFENSEIKEFTPPGEKMDGNDWVLIVTDSAVNYIKVRKSKM
jgi:hypothetical protein